MNANGNSLSTGVGPSAFRVARSIGLALVLALAGCASVRVSPESGIVRVACVGDSITYGSFLEDPAHEAYPVVLGRRLGPSHLVVNFGISGSTLMRRGLPPNQPYWGEQAFVDATNFQPHIVIIALGTNDSTPYNWRFKDTFTADAEALIDHFANLPTRPAVYVCLPPPAFRVNFSIEEKNLVEIRNRLRRIAAEKGAHVVDLETPLLGQEAWFPDGVHPDAYGAEAIADIVFAMLARDSSACRE